MCWKEDPDVSKCPKPTTPDSTPESTQPPTPEFTTRPTLTTTPRDLSDFDGCYSVNYDDKCPPVTVLGVFFPETERGQMRKVNCPQGQGKYMYLTLNHHGYKKKTTFRIYYYKKKCILFFIYMYCNNHFKAIYQNALYIRKVSGCLTRSMPIIIVKNIFSITDIKNV